MASTRNEHNQLLILLQLFLCLLVNISNAQWLTHGGDITNSRYARGEVLINPTNIRNNRLQLRWRFFTGSDVTATPAIADEIVYFPAWNGNLYAVNAFTGALVWSQNLTQLTNITATGEILNVTFSRTTPAIAGDLLIVGIYGPAVVIAVKRSTGELVWSRMIDRRPLIVITSSGTVYAGAFYVGVSSLEEGLPAQLCCTFRGSLVKLDVRTGVILWQTYTLPDNGGRLGGYSGAAIWGSSPSIDVVRGFVFAATGNLYTAPLEVQRCQEQQNNQTTPTGPDRCIGPDVNFNSMLAFDIETGNIRWSRQLGGYDVFFLVCLIPDNPECPVGPNVDADFGEAPMLLTIKRNRRLLDVVVAVQKSGFVWTLNRENGDIVWFKQAGPGGFLGGGTWGAATDGQTIYTNIVNSNRVSFRLAPSNQTTTAGAWVALDADTGDILWSTANPSNDFAAGPVTLTRGVLFAGSVAPNGPFYAMDARNGTILWTYNTGGTIYGGASAGYTCVYVGNGYALGLVNFPTWTRGTAVHAFCIEWGSINRL
ncbi:hypothetical protein AgCh_039785 [Apium graveolens]